MDDSSWEYQFDFCLFQAKKPDFFLGDSDFIQRSGNVIDFHEHLEDPKKKNILIGGNASTINEHFEEEFGKDFKILFFGDTLATDFAFLKTSSLKNWHFAFVFEELQEIMENIKLDEYYDYRSKWGSALFDIDHQGKI